MPKINSPLTAFNRGLVSRLALARVDVERMRLSAEEQTNWLPRTLGPMTLRPGLAYKASTKSDAATEVIPFVFSSTDTAAIELTASTLRVLINDVAITRASVTTTITNGDFGAGAGWTLSTSGGATATIASGVLTLAAPSVGGVATATNAVTVAAGEINTEHGLRISVTRGPVVFRAGTTSGGDDLIARTELETGTHSLAVTPGATTFYVQFESADQPSRIVDSITIEAAGTMELPTPWLAADLDYIRSTQSADVVFVACRSYQQRRIERRAARSWSIVLYKSDDGPFQSTASVANATVTPTGNTGDIVLTASRAVFKSTQVGSLFRIFQNSQNITASLAASDVYTSTIRVAGVGGARGFSVNIAGTWAGTLTLQRSFDGETSGFVDHATYTANSTNTVTDGLDNQVVWYRVGFKPAAYTSGTATVQLAFAGGGGAGVVRITAYTSTTEVSAEVLEPLKAVVGTTDWAEGEWSDRRGWPTAVAIHDGRLWWMGRDREWGSVSDAYDSFDADIEGDSGPINRSIGYGPIETINWVLPLGRLIVGTGASEISIRSSSFDEPLTPTNFTQKDCSTQGSANVQAVKMDTRGLFVQRSGQRVYELRFSVDAQDYEAVDLTQLAPDIAGSGGSITKMAIQRQPDTRIHCVRSDGKVAVLVYEPAEEVVSWWLVETDGVVENVYVLPDTVEDKVYYVVRRTINGATKRFHERFAREDQCTGLPGARLADCHLMYSGAATTTITGLSHLEGRSVIVWGWNTASPFTVTLPDGTTQTVGRDLGTYTVTGGQITGLSAAVTDACVGLSYEGRFKSAKLAYAAAMGTALTQKKRLNYLGLILANTHAQGLTHGQSYSVMDGLPLVEDGAEVDTNTVWSEFDQPMMETPGQWSTDARLHLKATAPRPATVLGAVIGIAAHDKG